ncbi:Transcription elongation factor B polypeptide 3 [Myotis davidii]|uniref:Transcription elongation factor B polypeptide 3 n=2 Tax=Myotis davidii TaxID=225400 RepID=L5M5V4_MYODS|nr:Transcription elongation factor B polypeptide 3 [Myotis davidii]
MAAAEEELDPPAMSFGASFAHHQPPSREASEHPVKRRKHTLSRKSHSDKDKRSLHGSDAGKGAGVLPPRVREKVGNTLKTPEGKVRTPPLGRKPAVPRLEEEEAFQPPTMSFQAEVTHDPRPSQVASDHPTLPWLAGAPGMSGAPSEVASENPMKKRKRKHSSQRQSHKDQQRLRGLDAGEGPGGLLPKVREKVGDTCKTPEGKVKTPHLGRKPAGPPPEVEEELDPPIMSSEASLTRHQPPARKERKSVKPPATALGGKSLRKEDRTSAQAEAGQSEKPFPPAAAGARSPQVPPAATPAWPDLGPCRGQPSDPPLPAFASMSSFQPRPRAPPSPGEEEGAGLMGIRLNSGTQAFSGSKRARRRKMITMLQQCVRTLQDSVTLLSQVRGVPCSLPQPAVESYTPEQRPCLEEHHGAPAGETEPLRKKQCHRALEKERREERTSQLQPQEQEVPERVLHISTNRPQDTPANMAFSDSSERGGAAVQEKALPAPAPTAGTRAPSHPASGHSCRPIPGKQVVSSHKKPVKKVAPLMAKSIKDYKNRCYRR